MASFVQVREAIIRTNWIWTSELWNDNQTKTIANSGMVSDFNVFQIGFLYVFYLLYIVRGSQTMKYLMNTVKPNISSLLFNTCRYISCCYICIKMIFENSRLPMLNTYIYIIEAYALQCRCSIKKNRLYVYYRRTDGLWLSHYWLWYNKLSPLVSFLIDVAWRQTHETVSGVVAFTDLAAQVKCKKIHWYTFATYSNIHTLPCI